MKSTMAIAASLLAPALVLGGPVINYTNTITEVDADGSGTFGDSDADFFTVGLTLKNASNGSENTATNLMYEVHLEGLGAFNLRDQFSYWTPGINDAGNTVYDFNGIHLGPTLENAVFYDVRATTVVGWDTATAYMEADTGLSNPIGATIPVIPEPATLGLVVGGAALLLGLKRRFPI